MTPSRKHLELTRERLKEILSYDPATGVFSCNKVRHQSHKIGDELGYDVGKGYLRIKVDGHQYPAHRLAWFYMTGEWPAEVIDHIDLDRSNNRWGNLRAATNCENLRNRPKNKNNTSGQKGVFWNKKDQKWVVKIGLNGTRHYLGTFDDFDKAVMVHQDGVARLHGEFAYRTAA